MKSVISNNKEGEEDIGSSEILLRRRRSERKCVSENRKGESSSNEDFVNRKQKRIHLVTKPADVWIHREGRVHEATFFHSNKIENAMEGNGKTTIVFLYAIKYNKF